LPQIQECGGQPCDTGNSLSTKLSIFESERWLDWSQLSEDDGWNSNQGFYEVSEEAQQARGHWARKWINARNEELIVVVCHHGFLRMLTGKLRIHPPNSLAWTDTYLLLTGAVKDSPESVWPNAEAREYSIIDDENYSFVRVIDSDLGIE
jgi:hypothetical protein